MGPRILAVLPQLPQDVSSGAAHSTRIVAEMAAESGFAVRVLATTATEGAAWSEPVSHLQNLGLRPEARRWKGHRELRFEQNGLPYTLLDTGRFAASAWESAHGRRFDQLFDDELATWKPDILFTYGGSPGDIRRMERARRTGARIAFRVANLGYLVKPFFRNIDAVLTPSRFLSDHYRAAIGMESTPLPVPLDLEEVLAPDRDPVFVTMVNPCPDKGLFLFARLAEELAVRHPDIAVLAIESRGTAGMLVEAGLRGGFDLRRHESVMVAGAVPRARDIFATARILLAPSVVEEASGRVVAEALVNGVPPLVSDRGGLAETCNGAGSVIPLPSGYTAETKKPLDAAAVEAWIEAIVRLCADEPFYQAESARAREAGRRYSRREVAPRYAAFFESLIASSCYVEA